MVDNAGFKYCDDGDLISEIEKVQSTTLDMKVYPNIGDDPFYLHSAKSLKVLQLERVGDIHVSVQGDRTRKVSALVTLHDIGQNHSTCFESFFCFHQFKPVADSFTVYHLNFPGQHEDASELADDYVYPSMEQMAGYVEEVFQYYNIKNAVCIGVGAGANVFSRLALKNPKIIDCLVLIGGSVGSSTWTEWGYEKMSSHYLKSVGMTAFCQDYLLWHFFGKIDERINEDLLGVVRDQLNRIKHPKNLALLIDSYSKRDQIKIKRPIPPNPTQTTLKCGVLLISGAHSPALEDTVDMNSKLDPTNSTWMKISDATSMVLDEKPTVVTNAIINFLQGYGYVTKLRAPSLSFASHEEITAPLDIC